MWGNVMIKRRMCPCFILFCLCLWNNGPVVGRRSSKKLDWNLTFFYGHLGSISFMIGTRICEWKIFRLLVHCIWVHKFNEDNVQVRGVSDLTFQEDEIDIRSWRKLRLICNLFWIDIIIILNVFVQVLAFLQV